MANGWTPERRAKQAEAIKRWQPWKSSTGPTTAAGKAKVSRNAFKGGTRQLLIDLNAKLKAARQGVKRLFPRSEWSERARKDPMKWR